MGEARLAVPRVFRGQETYWGRKGASFGSVNQGALGSEEGSVAGGRDRAGRLQEGPLEPSRGEETRAPGARGRDARP